MGGDTRRPLHHAQLAAAQIATALLPYTERAVVAGSVRRGKADVGDLELVVIPRMQVGLPDLFGQHPDPAPLLPEVLPGIPGVVSVPKRGPRYQQVIYQPDGQAAIQVDIFSATKDTFGYILMLRTGSAEFSHWMVTPRTVGGAKPGYFVVRDGAVWRIGGGITAMVPVPDEAALFAAWGMREVPVEARGQGYTKDTRWFL